MNLIEKYKAWKSAEHPAPIDLVHIWRVIRALFRKKTLPKTDYRAEQAKWRYEMKMNPICREQGTCKICGCTSEELVWDDASCEGNCYPKMMNEKEWDSYKKQNRIK